MNPADIRLGNETGQFDPIINVGSTLQTMHLQKITTISTAVLIAFFAVGCSKSPSEQPVNVNNVQSAPVDQTNEPSRDRNNEPSWDRNPVYVAALNGDLPAVQTALDLKPEIINQPVGKARSTLLHTAAYHGRARVVEELLRRKADVNARNLEGHTPLYDCVALDGTPEIALMLLKHGADPKIPDYAGKTPLQLAIEKHRDDMADCLRQHSAQK